MRALFTAFLMVILISGCIQQPTLVASSGGREIMGLKLSSAAFRENGSIPAQYTCDGQNTSPPLKIDGVPEQAKSLVLIMDDPDAVPATGKVWDHWVVWNIGPTTNQITENSVPFGAVQGVNGRGTIGYRGPCPPDKEHRYFFKLYAIDVKLELTEGATKADVEKAIEGRVLAQAELGGRYSRSQ